MFVLTIAFWTQNATGCLSFSGKNCTFVTGDNKKTRNLSTFPLLMLLLSKKAWGGGLKLKNSRNGLFLSMEIHVYSEFKLCRVMKAQLGRGGVPYITTHDGRTIRFPDPEIKVGDTIKFNLKTGNIEEFYKCENEASVMIIKGRNTGRVGNIRKVKFFFSPFFFWRFQKIKFYQKSVFNDLLLMITSTIRGS